MFDEKTAWALTVGSTGEQYCRGLPEPEATADERRARVEAEYGYLRGDVRGALEQVWGEIRTALDLEMVPPGTATELLEGLKLKCELGLDSPLLSFPLPSSGSGRGTNG